MVGSKRFHTWPGRDRHQLWVPGMKPLSCAQKHVRRDRSSLQEPSESKPVNHFNNQLWYFWVHPLKGPLVCYARRPTAELAIFYFILQDEAGSNEQPCHRPRTCHILETNGAAAKLQLLNRVAVFRVCFVLQ